MVRMTIIESEKSFPVVTGWQKKVSYISVMAKMSNEDSVKWYILNKSIYEKLSDKIFSIVLELIEESRIAIHAISHRTKEVESFKNKIYDPKYDDPVNQITDFSGIRIIAYVEDDLKPICKIIEDAFDIDHLNSGDKSNELGIDKVGYKSIHYIAKIKADRLDLPEYKKFKNLRFEIQVRTILQHAWAEIEHDKNYKFRGVLPPEIKRRFKIIAGTLELIDREFNSLSIEIDKIKEDVQNASSSQTLETIEISTTTVRELLLEKFNSQIDAKKVVDRFSDPETGIIEEVIDYGINNLKDLDAILDERLMNFINETIQIRSVNLTSIIRIALLANDYKKYFAKSWKKKWVKIHKSFAQTLEDIDKEIIVEIHKHKIEIS